MTKGDTNPTMMNFRKQHLTREGMRSSLRAGKGKVTGVHRAKKARPADVVPGKAARVRE